MKENFLKLTLVTNKGQRATSDYLKFIESCLVAGVTCVQLREKDLRAEDLLSFGSLLKDLLDSYKIPLIVNDDVELCIKLNAFGVHLGQSDTEVTKARSILGADKVIGLSVNSIEQVKSSLNLPVDYLGVGAIFPTKSKPDIETIWGLDELKKASKLSPLPIVAIGGVDESNAFFVIKSGAKGIAAIAAFHDSTDPLATTKNLKETIQKAFYDK